MCEPRSEKAKANPGVRAFSRTRVASHMISRGYGRIINIASVTGKEGNPNASAYSASKAAVIGMTKSLGKELARTGRYFRRTLDVLKC